jgi:hypothetical protein
MPYIEEIMTGAKFAPVFFKDLKDSCRAAYSIYIKGVI